MSPSKAYALILSVSSYRKDADENPLVMNIMLMERFQPINNQVWVSKQEFLWREKQLRRKSHGPPPKQQYQLQYQGLFRRQQQPHRKPKGPRKEYRGHYEVTIKPDLYHIEERTKELHSYLIRFYQLSQPMITPLAKSDSDGWKEKGAQRKIERQIEQQQGEAEYYANSMVKWRSDLLELGDYTKQFESFTDMKQNKGIHFGSFLQYRPTKLIIFNFVAKD